MIDFYGLGEGFPGTPLPEHLSNIQKVEYLERGIQGYICGRIPDLHPDFRLIPYLSLHEYEGLLCLAIRSPSLMHSSSPIRLIVWLKFGMIFRRRRTSMMPPGLRLPNA